MCGHILQNCLLTLCYIAEQETGGHNLKHLGQIEAAPKELDRFGQMHSFTVCVNAMKRPSFVGKSCLAKDNGDGVITHGEFVDGMLRCKGPARAMEQASLCF